MSLMIFKYAMNCKVPATVQHVSYFINLLNFTFLKTFYELLSVQFSKNSSDNIISKKTGFFPTPLKKEGTLEEMLLPDFLISPLSLHDC